MEKPLIILYLKCKKTIAEAEKEETLSICHGVKEYLAHLRAQTSELLKIAASWKNRRFSF
jgi:hypothetical protein